MSADRTPTPVPFTKIALLGSILLANNTSIWMIFSFLPFMVSHFYPELPTVELGYEAGILGSAFSCGGLIGNFVSGVLSDKVGRRPALLWGLLGTAVSSLCFGFSPSFWVAVASRFMWGVLNGNIGVAKTYLSEISDDTNLARGMAYFGVIGSIGRVVGPIIGGLLSYPAESMPTIFDGTVFETYPFALPSVVVSVNCIIMFIVAYYWLPETLKSKVVQEAITRSTNLSGGGAHGGVQYSALLTTDGSDTDDRLGNESPTNDSGNSCDKNGSIELQRLKIGNGQLEDAVAKDESRNPLLTDINFENIAALEEGNKAAGGGATKKRVQKEQQQFLPLAVNGRGRLSGETETESVDSAFAPVTFSPHRKAAISPDQSRRSISFFSLVKVKVIDHPRISYQGLKQVGEDEAPLDGPVRQTLRASQPSASSPSPSDSQQQLVAGPLNAHLPDMSLRMQLQQEKEDNRNGIGNDDNELEENLLPSVRYSNGAEYFESVDSSKNLASNLAYLFKQRQVFVSTTLYGFGSFIVIIGNEVFTLWVVTSRADGGLNYNTQQIGTAIMFCGVIGTFLQLFLYPYAVDKLGVLKVHRWGAVLIALSSILIPNLPSMAGPDSPVLVLVLTVALLTLQALAATWYLVSTFVLISNSCYSHQLATVNGIGQTCASIGRLTGPYIGSVVFAWSETNGLAWPCNHYLVFYILAVLAAVSYQYSTLLPKSIQRRKREPKFRTWEDADAFYRLQEQQEQREQRAQQLEQQALHGQLEVQLRQKDTNREIRDNVTTGDQRPPANKFVANV